MVMVGGPVGRAPGFGGGQRNPMQGTPVRPVGLGSPTSFKRGGKVKKTGLAKVEKGEKVLTKKQASKR